MKTDTVVTLDNNENYLLLLKSEINNESYFLAVLLYNNDPSNKYFILKEVIKEKETFIQKVSNPILMSRLLEEYKKIYDSSNKR